VQGAGFRVQGTGLRVQGSGFRVHSVEYGFLDPNPESRTQVGRRLMHRTTGWSGIWGSGVDASGVDDSGLMIQGCWCRRFIVQEFRVDGSGGTMPGCDPTPFCPTRLNSDPTRTQVGRRLLHRTTSLSGVWGSRFRIDGLRV
jgi:hypothetical protein